MLQASLTGTLFIYQGQEIGMTNLPRSWSIDEYKDINTINYYKDFKENMVMNLILNNVKKIIRCD